MTDSRAYRRLFAGLMLVAIVAVVALSAWVLWPRWQVRQLVHQLKSQKHSVRQEAIESLIKHGPTAVE